MIVYTITWRRADAQIEIADYDTAIAAAKPATQSVHRLPVVSTLYADRNSKNMALLDAALADDVAAFELLAPIFDQSITQDSEPSVDAGPSLSDESVASEGMVFICAGEMLAQDEVTASEAVAVSTALDLAIDSASADDVVAIGFTAAIDDQGSVQDSAPVFMGIVSLADHPVASEVMGFSVLYQLLDQATAGEGTWIATMFGMADTATASDSAPSIEHISPDGSVNGTQINELAIN